MRYIWLTAAIFMIASTIYARSGDDFRFVKHVPAGAAINYTIDGSIVQSLPLRPGSYEIVVRRLGRTGE